jgi:hypothetical protein
MSYSFYWDYIPVFSCVHLAIFRLAYFLGTLTSAGRVCYWSSKFSRKIGKSRFIWSTSFPNVWTCNPLDTYRPLGLTCCYFLHYCKQCVSSKPQNEASNLKRSRSCKTLISFAFAKLGKATMSFVVSVCLFVRPSVRMEQLGFHWTDYHEIIHLSVLRKSVEKFNFH